MDLDAKLKKLENILKGFPSLLVAYSGGVDSAFLLAVAKKVLKEKVVAVTGDSPIHPGRETRDAVLLAEKLNVRHLILQTREMELPEFLKNPENRCYICKKNLLTELQKIGKEMGITRIAHGANMDDLLDYRPGSQAATELGTLSPLADAGLTKEDIRTLSREMGLPTWNKPSTPCMATRMPYNTPINKAVLGQIEAAENVLYDLGIRIFRVRHQGDLARIEVSPDKFSYLIQPDIRKIILSAFRELGYLYISLDLEGYVSGSMDRSLVADSHGNNDRDR
jgi:pyridinium-3,5-biscarboxylic acid mononucleotide sulfurtransferase